MPAPKKLQVQHQLPARRRMLQEQRPPLACPRCKSANTKFCYFNNHSVEQPRHLCRSCRRFWTQGGKLCNIAVGSAKRSKKAAPSSSSASKSSLSVLSSVLSSVSLAPVHSGMVHSQAPTIPNDHQLAADHNNLTGMTDIGDMNWMNLMMQLPPAGYYPWENSFGFTDQFLQPPPQIYNPYDQNAVQMNNVPPPAFFASPAVVPDAFFAADAKGKSKMNGEDFGSGPSSSQI